MHHLEEPGGMRVDDRALNVLDNYEWKVLRTWKGRGAILFETNNGTKILKEYIGPVEKVSLQDQLIHHMKDKGISNIDAFERNKEGEIISYDRDHRPYIVKEYIDGRDCNIWDVEECKNTAQHLAKLHKAMEMNTEKECIFLPVPQINREYEKHNKELKRIRNFIRGKGQKTDFEIFLLHHYDTFYDQAVSLYQQIQQQDWTPLYEEVKSKGTMCHGDYQYHNIHMNDSGIAVINFEKYALDVQIKDLYLFMRKVLEKNLWDVRLGDEILTAYESEKPLNPLERRQLYYRFTYPEKFWKIVNFYYNSGKSWIPMRHMDKLEKLIAQEPARKQFLQIFS
ncbi:MAG: CotS family spore coat protein [Lachnospiraceae bacterium]|nr:CotS family spore coat protein [Lachnospiraceae bacterium]